MTHVLRKHQNNPLMIYIVINAVVAMCVFYSVMEILPFTNQNPTGKYSLPFYIYLFWWIFFGVSFKKYLHFRKRRPNRVMKNCFKADFTAFAIGLILIFLLPEQNYSKAIYILYSITLFFIELILVSVYYAFHEAEVASILEIQSTAGNLRPEITREDHRVNEEVKEFISNYIILHRGEKLLSFLKDNASLFWSSTLLINTTERFNIEKVSKTRYATIINLHQINDIRGINKFMATINRRLPFGGRFVGCFEEREQRKKRIIGSQYKLFGKISYIKDCFVFRFMPHFNLTRELYFWITAGRGRVLSKAEVFGRAYFSGFKILEEVQINKLSYFVAEKIQEPLTMEPKSYSYLLALERIGKGESLFKVYKFRTMYPYSSYLQCYLYQKNNLDAGGKFKEDFRITTLGRFLRRYWLDELPMLASILKGNMKLVGVRPLSKQYFSLYSKELQQQRVRHKPGLLPPFYADLPKSLDEIQASEKKYLDLCEKRGTFLTDMRYFVIILINILFKKVRSQ
ncbi:MAG: sugar transferase [Bacteroidetes bacterium]|nr:sugar transferase [Bacteroidota bacterium]